MFIKRNFLIIIVVLAVLIILLIIFFTPKTPVWHAVHLNNGQVYFGQIKSINPETIKLAAVYYLEAYQSPPEEQTMQSESFQIQPIPQQTYQLVKRGNSQMLLTDNTLFINRATVLFWEKLKPDSEIVKLIEKNLESKK